ncbi:NIPSNAP family protein [Bradyrhizobium sp.]|uniref:NIPSNAP family protein n=1 Tax=Bradyrhizobium sp. TaxID=376 RepID=UPI003C75D878
MSFQRRSTSPPRSPRADVVEAEHQAPEARARRGFDLTIYERRTYQIHAGKAAEFLKVYEANCPGIITRYARPIGCWTKE